MGFTIAFVSSSVVVPTMIHLKEQACGVDKDIPVISLYIAGQFYEASRKTHLLQQRDIRTSFVKGKNRKYTVRYNGRNNKNLPKGVVNSTSRRGTNTLIEPTKTPKLSRTALLMDLF